MKRLVMCLVAAIAALSLMFSGYVQAATTAAPTAAPGKKVDYPQKGRYISYIVPFPPGGGVDLSARLLAPYLEKELGIPVQVVNRPGAGSQVGMTELSRAKPDGYTLSTVDMPTIHGTYLLPERGAVYNRKSFQPLWMYYYTVGAWVTRAESPFKNLKDAIDAAKARGGNVKVGDPGLMNPWNLVSLAVQRQTGTKFAHVHFDGSGPSMTAVLGGHVDLGSTALNTAYPHYKHGAMRVLGITGKQREKLIPDVPTFVEQGVNLVFPVWYVVTAPAGLPKEIGDILITALKNATTSDAFRKRAEEMMMFMAPPMTTTECEAVWEEYDRSMLPLLEMARDEK